MMATPTVAWRVIGASVVGTSHRSRGRPCEDAHGHRLLADGGLALAVADGAGSAAHASTASARAVESALEFVEQAFAAGHRLAGPTESEDLLREAIQAARRALVDLASTAPDPRLDDDAPLATVETEPRLADYATTLLLAIISPGRVAAAQVGDGAIVVGDGAGAVRALTRPDHGEYLNQTTFLTSSDFLERARFALSDGADLSAIALLSDGLEMVSLNWATGEPHAPFFSPLWDFAREPSAAASAIEEFLASDRLSAYTDDDKTLVLAVSCTTAPTDAP